MFDVKDTDFFDMEDAAFDTIIENDISFTGNMKFVKPMMIRGVVNGSITSDSDLVIDTGAIVNAEIKSSRVLIKGQVKGNIQAENLIFVTAKGSLDGDISTKKVVLEPGCLFSGKCTMIK